MKTEKTKGGFTVGPTSIVGHSVVLWDFDSTGPRRSLQVETEIAEIWAAAGTAATEVEDMGYNGLEVVKALPVMVTALKELEDTTLSARIDDRGCRCKRCSDAYDAARALLARLKGGSDET